MLALFMTLNAFFPSKLEKPIKPLYIHAEENQMTLFKEKFF